MIKNLLLFVFCCLQILVYGQNAPLDSLEQRFSTEKDNGQKLELLSWMTSHAFEENIHVALGYAKRGVALSEQTGDKNWQPKFYEMQGRMHANLLQLDSAVLFFNKATIGYQAVGNKKGEATTAFKLAWVHKKKGEIAPAMRLDLQALRIMEEIGDKAGTADAYYRVSEDLLRQGQHSEGLTYAQKAIEICQQNNYQPQLAIALRCAGDACIAAYKPAEALEYYNQALKITYDQKSGYLTLADIINCRGNAYKRLGRYNEALKDYQECLELGLKASYPAAISTAYANLGEVYLLMGNYAKALIYQLKTTELQEKDNDLSNLVENYGHLSTTYEHLGNYPLALLYQKKARQLRDSTASLQSDMAITELRTQYETEKQQTTIAAQQQQIAQQHNIQWLGLGVVALLAILAFSYYRNAVNRKKVNTLLSLKNAENELLLKEIHHRVKNNLEVVSSLLSLQSAQVEDKNIKEAMLESQNRVHSIGIVHQKLYQGTNLAAVEMKGYCIDLSESILDSFGADERVTIECAMDQLELDIDTAVPLGLIINELITNALKYAFPKGQTGKISIKLEKTTDTNLHLEVADNGIGKTGPTQGTGFGSQLVSLLTKQLSGTMQEKIVDGTTVSFNFNLPKVA